MNYKKILPLLASTVYSFFLFAQEHNYTLYFRSGEIYTEENSKQWQSILDKKANSYIDKHYVCLQFFDIPTPNQKENIASYGIELISYMPYYAYLAAVPEGLSIQTLQKLNVRAIVEINSQQKMHPQLLEESYPDWALSEDKISIKVQIYKNISLTDILDKFRKSKSIEILTTDFYFHQLIFKTDTSFLQEIAELPFVQFIEPIDPQAQPENYSSRTNHRTNYISSEYGSGRHFTGKGIKIALGDDGIIGPHIDYQGRIASVHVSVDDGSHGDHVAGTIMGAGNLDPLARGMATGADIHVYDVWDAVDSSIYSYYNPGIRITSISYSNGCNAGYTTRAYNVDQMVRTMPSLLPVFSAGNEGASDCSYGAGAGWGNVTGGIKIGKNVLAVANLDLIDQLNSSSSRGPASDGRLKPDISAVGTDVYSTVSTNDYDTYTGTSMACPGTSGTLTALYEAYQTLYGSLPESGLMKGVLLNSADDIGNPGPDFKHGWGRLNARRAVETLEKGQWFSDSLSQGVSNTHQITVPSGVSEFRVMVYWTDYEGTINSSVALVNDIDIQLTTPDLTVYNPWVLNSTPDPALLDSNAVRGHDTLNNMEQVTIENPTAGVYQLTVSGYQIPENSQEYFVIYEFLDSSIIITHPNGGESVVPDEIELIRWDTYGSSGTFDVSYSSDSGNTWNAIASAVAADERYAYWWVPDTVVSGKCLIRVSRGSMYDESDTLFSIITTPKNLQVDTSCLTSLVLSWDSVSEAGSYDIFQLGSMYMDSIGTTSQTYYTISVNNTYLSNEWFAVRARGKDGAVGRRCVAINFDSLGVQNCLLERDLELTSISSPEDIYPGCYTASGLPVSVLISNTGKYDISNLELSYELTGYSTVTEQYTGTISSGTGLTYTFSQTLPVSDPGYYELMVWISDTSSDNQYNDTIQMDFILLTTTTDSVLPLQDFEDIDLCSTNSTCGEDSCELDKGWINISNYTLDDMDWRVNEGNTPSNNTGPSKDHTLGTSDGNYIYLEATDCYNQTATLISPCIDLSGYTDPCLSFWYNMFGSDMGDLQLDVFSDGSWYHEVFTKSGTIGSVWINEKIDLTNYVGKTIAIAFKGITGDNYKSDMALDDIEITTLSKISENSMSSNAISVYPNPAKDEITVFFSNLNHGLVRMQLMDANSKIVLQTEKEITTLNDSQIMNLSTLAYGFYILKIENEKGIQFVKISKQ